MHDIILNDIAKKLRGLDYSRAQLVFCERFDEHSRIWNLSRHMHDHFELLFFLDGRAQIHGKGDDLNISVFDAVIYPENIYHQEFLDFSKHQEIVCLWLKFHKASNIDHIFSLSDYENRLKWLFTEIHRQEKKGRSLIVKHLIEVLMLYIQQYCEEGFFTHQSTVERVKQYIHNNFSHRITIPELASIANVSPSYLNRIFRKKLGKTPIEYVNMIRIKASRQLLSQKDLTVMHISELVGIDDPKYFTRLFKKYSGLSPREYREMIPQNSD
jgi:AraC-like DNA-binding protein